MSFESELAKRDRLLAAKSARIRELEAQLEERTCKQMNNGGYSYRFECSRCNYESIVHNCKRRLDEKPNYCPNCGARVIGVDE